MDFRLIAILRVAFLSMAKMAEMFLHHKRSVIGTLFRR